MPGPHHIPTRWTPDTSTSISIAFPAGAISEVIVGPGAHTGLRKQAVEQLLAENKYYDTKVRTSVAPYLP